MYTVSDTPKSDVSVIAGTYGKSSPVQILTVINKSDTGHTWQNKIVISNKNARLISIIVHQNLGEYLT